MRKSGTRNEKTIFLKNCFALHYSESPHSEARAAMADSDTDSNTDTELGEKERVRSRKSLLKSTTDCGDSPQLHLVKRKKSHALLERLNKVKTPSHTPQIMTKEELLEKKIENLKEQLEKHEEILTRLEELDKTRQSEQKVDESCCIGYCTIF